MIQLIATLKGCQGYAVLQNAISASVMPAGSAGASLLQSLAAYTTASNQQLTGVAVLAQCLLGASSSSWQSGRSFSSSSSSGSSTPDSSLRADLGSGSALGSMGVHQAESDTAKRRKSLLTKSGRFYETVNVAPYTSPDGSQQQQQHQEQAGGSSSGYQLLLRKYPIKTPAKNVLVLPTYSLALAVAAEWEWLPTGKPVPHLMPLTSLAATAIDQPKERSRVIEHLLKYVHTDGACIRYEPGPLEQRQQKVFDPLLQWAQQRLGWQLVTSHSIFGSTQPDTTVAAVQSWLQGLDQWQLAAAEQLISVSKSVVIAAALLHGRINVAEAVAAARVEEDFQLEDWGMVEAGHDLDIADTKSRIGAPAVFARLLAQP